MKIWMDLTNSPHVNFFKHMLHELSREHDVFVTCRPLSNTIELLELEDIAHTVVGRHYGASKLHKLIGFPIRIAQLCAFLRRHRVDVAIAQSSYYLPVAARLCGVRNIFLNDNEHATGNLIAFPFATLAMLPESLEPLAKAKRWNRFVRLVFYPGVKEGIYLWNYDSPAADAAPDRQRPRVYVRPEPWAAHYYSGARNFLDAALGELKARCDITLLPRDAAQRDHYRSAAFSGITVAEQSRSITDIMSHCDCFIGAGGTMTREAAVLGIPTISVYQDDLLRVDHHLIERGAMIHKPDLSADFVMEFIASSKRHEPDATLRKHGREAYDLIKWTLLHLG
ncbi:MAG: DUF354 domain-containing protein [Verrucomicrobia bacterium]|nr:DUF354 domain-containing protein [Verrucomicrobiota bacterium]